MNPMSMNQDTSRNHYTNALDLMIMSVYKPDAELRNEARDLGCLDELLDIRESTLEHLQGLRRVNK